MNKLEQEERMTAVLSEARSHLRLEYPDDNPTIYELHIAGVTLKGLAEYEAVIRRELTTLQPKTPDQSNETLPKGGI